MLRLLGVRFVPSAALGYLILATVFLFWGFLVNILAAALRSNVLFVVGTLMVVAGAGCGLLAVYKAGQAPKS
jgi:hypothetical protein